MIYDIRRGQHNKNDKSRFFIRITLLSQGLYVMTVSVYICCNYLVHAFLSLLDKLLYSCLQLTYLLYVMHKVDYLEYTNVNQRKYFYNLLG